MVHSCPECRVFLSFQRKETLNPDLVSGHWYGCPGCARNICAACGMASGRRCRECGATLEPDQFFPRDLKPLEDWREYLPHPEEATQGTDLRSALELIACSTEATIPQIDEALEDWARERFRGEVFTYDLMRRVGSTDYFIEWGGTARELRWTPEWEQRLAVAAAYYREQAGPAGREALELRELLRGWIELAPASLAALPVILDATLHPEDSVSEEARRVFYSLEPPLPEVLAWSVPVLCGGDPGRVLAVLATLRTVRRWHGPELHWRADLAVAQKLSEALARCGEAEVESLVRRILFTREPWPMDVTAVAIVELGLTAEVEALLKGLLASLLPRAQRRLQSFIASLTAPVTLASEAEALRARCQQLSREARTVEDRLELMKLSFRLEPAQRSVLLPGVPPPAELLYTLLQETDRSFAADLHESWVKELLCSPDSRAWLLSYAARQPHHYLTTLIFSAAGPESEGLIVLLQRLLADRNTGPAERGRWVRTLGHIASGPHSPASALLRQLFLDARESVSTRLTAARALWSLGVRALPVSELAPALGHRSAAIRSWALLLMGQAPAELLAPLREDPSPLVRWVASRM
ncbi:MAG TPA: hypothetical protein VF815_38600 [Myxococcaceae bacterium]|jgi:hypothetical protein